jgi:hemoglobin-like flavoprotein
VKPDRIALIRSTWSAVAASKQPVAHLFYERLFALDPSLRSQFRSDIESQGRKLLDMMQSIVSGLEDKNLLSAARELGRRHHYYGVRDEDYDTVREAMMWMFEVTLGQSYTPQADQAWRELYGVLAEAMIEGAGGAKGNAPAPPNGI